MTDPRITAFFADSAHPGALDALRALLLGAGLQESFKWRGPCYGAHGGIICTIWGFRDAAALGFFKGALLDDPQALLDRPGPNSRAVRLLRFADALAVQAAAPAILGFVEQAVANEAAGRKVDLPPDDFDLPEELIAALDADPGLQAAWDALTPGRRRGWVLHVGQARQSATRSARVDRARDRILAGKGMHDR